MGLLSVCKHFQVRPKLQVYFSVHRNWPGKGMFISYYRNGRAKKNETRGLIGEKTSKILI